MAIYFRIFFLRFFLNLIIKTSLNNFFLKGSLRVNNDSNSIILKPLADIILDIITNRITR
jgi:hypothetical protein